MDLCNIQRSMSYCLARLLAGRVDDLNLMGVDLTSARQVGACVLRTSFTLDT